MNDDKKIVSDIIPSEILYEFEGIKWDNPTPYILECMQKARADEREKFIEMLDKCVVRLPVKEYDCVMYGYQFEAIKEALAQEKQDG